MTQRILQPGEIESLDRTAIPRIRLPEQSGVFAARATRLSELAHGHRLSGYLQLMAVLVAAQERAFSGISARMPSDAAMAEAQAHSMPIANALTPGRDPVWRDVLRQLVERVDAAGAVTPALAALLERLRCAADVELASAADAVLALRFAEIDPAAAPFLMAALQVVWTQVASRLDPRAVPYLEAPGLCPVCGSLPVASIVRIGGAFHGYRYLQCSLCATEWHMVRVKCSHCDSTRGIAYHGVEGGNEALKAESCDECRCYRKIGYQEKDHAFEPLADDLASITLDVLMGEAGYQRASPNPLLWPLVTDGAE
ncbi:formate dehydrogenase accessory protein FdhE [Trinickia caryophylli]|uniref:Protein FdhE homolog n=1 Tax=Trinickia caryophylli TaxID=28094 RepID=A0A1X7G3P7_TRICW|nr:formate dehydrogenase accessory protein FdhE [Trinickia caryophylli]PMS13694.1 formate dehydrogenase accessory protein FdhE [Trinickia caryophylli]TRX14188.1 formate dehydrogenase accessory protein FdhE [Trinickia caryophylli]WQE14012.1 formate dehydrogenase accessory protein FdhE [Trinickia caryophylli]SMF62686.1 FdhE protein [Trinickia caryophylli]GLU33504.1 protein FdhE [Trinickia caryophylli]